MVRPRPAPLDAAADSAGRRLFQRLEDALQIVGGNAEAGILDA